MTIRHSHSPPVDPASGSSVTACSHCGGSGTLRLDDSRYRTCLECLGSGRRDAAAAALLLLPDLSALTPSSSAAR